jgi:hypothetical protein
LIEIEGLRKHYCVPNGRTVEVLKGISLTVPAGSIINPAEIYVDYAA